MGAAAAAPCGPLPPEGSATRQLPVPLQKTPQDGPRNAAHTQGTRLWDGAANAGAAEPHVRPPSGSKGTHLSPCARSSAPCRVRRTALNSFDRPKCPLLSGIVCGCIWKRSLNAQGAAAKGADSRRQGGRGTGYIGGGRREGQRHRGYIGAAGRGKVARGREGAFGKDRHMGRNRARHAVQNRRVCRGAAAALAQRSGRPTKGA